MFRREKRGFPLFVEKAGVEYNPFTRFPDR